MTDPQSLWRTHFGHPTPWATEFAPRTMVDLLAETAARTPAAALIDFEGRTFSYAKTLAAARRVAAGLHRLGYGKGDRIGLFLPNVPHYVAAYYGIAMLGATAVNFSPLYTVKELAEQVADSGTRVLFTLSATALLPKAIEVLDASGLERLIVGSVAGALPPAKSALYRLFKRKEVTALPADSRVSRFSALIANEGVFPAPTLDPDDVALIQYTGGTTGTPKGAMLSHANLAANARQVVSIDGNRDLPDRIIGALPLFHVFANTCVLNRTVVNGGCMVLLPRFDAGQVLAAIARTGATSLPGVPTMYRALMDHSAFAKTDFSSLRVCVSGGAPLAAELQQRFGEATGARLVEGYGLSESSGVLSTNPYEGAQRPGTIGQPLPGTTLRLVDKEDPSRDAPAGEPGEIVAAGPQIMQGYWNRPDADADVFIHDANGTRWLRTGDVGVIDPDGFVRIVDRIKDMIAVSGFKVFPSQVEAVLYHHPAIKEALVIGVADAYRGEQPRAFVALEDGAEVGSEALRDWLNPQLGKHERVDRVVIRPALPKTLIGKLSRKDLVQELAAEDKAGG
jgi:long-chain acyl-CoA synthetase